MKNTTIIIFERGYSYPPEWGLKPLERDIKVLEELYIKVSESQMYYWGGENYEYPSIYIKDDVNYHGTHCIRWLLDTWAADSKLHYVEDKLIAMSKEGEESALVEEVKHLGMLRCKLTLNESAQLAAREHISECLKIMKAMCEV